jgi:hypothetical protein
MSDQCREKNQNPDENDQSPFIGFKFSLGLPMRTAVVSSVVLHRITSFLGRKGGRSLNSAWSGGVLSQQL